MGEGEVGGVVFEGEGRARGGLVVAPTNGDSAVIISVPRVKFDKRKYQREFMRKKRGSKPLVCPHCGKEF